MMVLLVLGRVKRLIGGDRGEDDMLELLRQSLTRSPLGSVFIAVISITVSSRVLFKASLVALIDSVISLRFFIV